MADGTQDIRGVRLEGSDGCEWLVMHTDPADPGVVIMHDLQVATHIPIADLEQLADAMRKVAFAARQRFAGNYEPVNDNF